MMQDDVPGRVDQQCRIEWIRVAHLQQRRQHVDSVTPGSIFELFDKWTIQRSCFGAPRGPCRRVFGIEGRITVGQHLRENGDIGTDIRCLANEFKRTHIRKVLDKGCFQSGPRGSTQQRAFP